jgi:DNA-binding NtrC family response regulator
VDCAALPEALLERELFGMPEGDARAPRRPGRVERAEGGTLFLRELSAAGPSLQGRIRQMLKAFHFERPGGGEVVPVDVRVVACDLERRDDADLPGRPPDTELRTEFLPAAVTLLPLRHRLEEVVPLALHFARQAAEGRGRRLEGIGGEALDLLRAHPWPGNLRELRFVMERAVFRARGAWLGGAELGLHEGAAHLGSGGRAEAGYPPTRSLAEVERDHIAKVLRYTGGAMGRTAELLGIHRNTLTRKVEQYELRTDPEEGNDG